jgi:hypothetical protein
LIDVGTRLVDPDEGLEDTRTRRGIAGIFEGDEGRSVVRRLVGADDAIGRRISDVDRLIRSSICGRLAQRLCARVRGCENQRQYKGRGNNRFQ